MRRGSCSRHGHATTLRGTIKGETNSRKIEKKHDLICEADLLRHRGNGDLTSSAELIYYDSHSRQTYCRLQLQPHLIGQPDLALAAAELNELTRSGTCCLTKGHDGVVRVHPGGIRGRQADHNSNDR
jgi:hypothetical protein